MSDHYEMKIADLEDQIKELEKAQKTAMATATQFSKKNNVIKKLREALEFYADEKNWTSTRLGPNGCHDASAIRGNDLENTYMDHVNMPFKKGGKRARKALEVTND